MMEEGTLVYVSEPYLGGVCEYGEDDTRENPSPGEERKSTDGVT
jgi:hypothetical protein